MRNRSDIGAPPTAEELELIGRADTARVSDAVGQWALLAKRVGLGAVFAVFDEFAGEKILIPTRSGFVDALWRPERDAQMFALAASGKGFSEIAREMACSRQLVHHVLTAPGADIGGVAVVKRRR